MKFLFAIAVYLVMLFQLPLLTGIFTLGWIVVFFIPLVYGWLREYEYGIFHITDSEHSEYKP